MAIHCESSHDGIRHYSRKISNSTNESMTAMLPPGSSHVLPGPDLFSSFHHEYRAAGNAVPYPFYAVLDNNTPDHDEEIDNERNFHRVEKKRRLTNEQVKSLETSFDVESKLEPERKSQLAEELGLQPRQVAVWFQNRRARSKTKQLERDYDILKMEYDAVVLQRDKLESEVARLSHLLDSGQGKVASSCHISSMKEHIEISSPTIQNNPQYHLQEQDDKTQVDQALNPTTAAHYQHSPSLQSDDARSKQMIMIKHGGSDAGDASSDSDQADALSCRSTPAEKYIPEQFYHQAAAAKPSLAERLYNDPHQFLQQIARVKMEEGFLQVPDMYSSDYFQTYDHEEGDSILCFSWQ